MALSNSRTASSLGGQLGGLASIDPLKTREVANPIDKAQAGLSQAASTTSSMHRGVEEPGKSVGGAAMAGVGGVTAGVALSGTGAAIGAASTGAAAAGTSGLAAGLTAVGPIGWAVGGIALAAYLLG